MRFAPGSALAILLALSSQAAADPPAAPAPPATTAADIPRASVVAIQRDAGQAVLWDTNQGRYVAVRVGDVFQQFRVTVIDTEHLVLTHLTQPNQHFVLARAEPAAAARPATPPATPSVTASAVTAQAPTAVLHGHDKAAEILDPYASSQAANPSAAAPARVSTSTVEVLDPYGTSKPIRVVKAPSASPAPASSPAMGGLPTLPSTSDLTALRAAAAPAQPPATASAGPAVARLTPQRPAEVRPAVGDRQVSEERYTVSRSEFDAAVTDFAVLSKEVRIALVPDGVHITDIARGSFFHRLGIRSGDVVLEVDGTQMANLDAAAGVYARLMDARKFAVKVRRGTATVTLRYTFTK